MSSTSPLVSADDVKAWFDYALGRDDPRPDDAVYAQIAGDLRKLINRYNNQSLPPEQRLDIQPADLIAEAHVEVMEAANRLLFSLEKLGELLPMGRLWNRVEDGFAYDELASFLRDMDVSGHIREDVPKGPGNTKAGWHAWAHSFSAWVERALQEAGYKGNLNRTNRTGMVAQIGAIMVHHITGDTCQPETFADAMAKRRVTRSRHPRARFPHADRLKKR